MLEAGRDAWFDNSKILESARFTSEEVNIQTYIQNIYNKKRESPLFIFFVFLLSL
jgi:hypothetical protein